MALQDTPVPPAEIKPPWISYPTVPPDDFFWREAGEPWLNLVWRPFWDSLDKVARDEYLDRFPPPEVWQTSFLDDRLDRLMAEIDSESGLDELTTPVAERKKVRRPWQFIWRLLAGGS